MNVEGKSREPRVSREHAAGRQAALASPTCDPTCISKLKSRTSLFGPFGGCVASAPMDMRDAACSCGAVRCGLPALTEGYEDTGVGH